MKFSHGGDTYTRSIEHDFSVNINPLGMPKSVKEALINNIDKFENYPDVNCTRLKNAIAEYENISVQNIVCGNGAADLIYRTVQTLQPKKALIVVPTFSEYEKALVSVDCKIEYYFLSESNRFELDNKIIDKLHGIDMIFLCNPNNPTGNLIEPDLIYKIINKCDNENIRVFIDECFTEFVENKDNYCVHTDRKNVIILKAFTKIYAMAGLRLGYMLCRDTDLNERVENCGQCWSVSVPAQISGIAAIQEREYVQNTVKLISEERAYLTGELSHIGFKVYPSKTNFILFKSCLPIDELLLTEKIAIRNCDNYVGLGNGYFRTAVKTHRENELLINAIERVIKNG